MENEYLMIRFYTKTFLFLSLNFVKKYDLKMSLKFMFHDFKLEKTKQKNLTKLVPHLIIKENVIARFIETCQNDIKTHQNLTKFKQFFISKLTYLSTFFFKNFYISFFLKKSN